MHPVRFVFLMHPHQSPHQHNLSFRNSSPSTTSLIHTMSPLKDFCSSSFDKEPTALAPVNRRNKAIPTDSAPARFFYAMLRQLDLKKVGFILHNPVTPHSP
ncbi:hypothetical protein BDV19DRAFT_358682 [Aspergillus venezuelensis]